LTEVLDADIREELVDAWAFEEDVVAVLEEAV
jgi:hypothetical protein